MDSLGIETVRDDVETLAEKKCFLPQRRFRRNRKVGVLHCWIARSRICASVRMGEIDVFQKMKPGKATQTPEHIFRI